MAQSSKGLQATVSGSLSDARPLTTELTTILSCKLARVSSNARLIQVLMVLTGTPYFSESYFLLSPRM